jgi:hypothetical protein
MSSFGRGRKDLKEREVESSCIACSKGKRKGVPPKTRWKEEQKEKAQGPRELQNGKWKAETRRGSEGTKAKGKENRVAGASSSEGASAESAQGRGKPRPILEGARRGAEGTEREGPKMPVACVNGVPMQRARSHGSG